MTIFQNTNCKLHCQRQFTFCLRKLSLRVYCSTFSLLVDCVMFRIYCDFFPLNFKIWSILGKKTLSVPINVFILKNTHILSGIKQYKNIYFAWRALIWAGINKNRWFLLQAVLAKARRSLAPVLIWGLICLLIWYNKLGSLYVAWSFSQHGDRVPNAGALREINKKRQRKIEKIKMKPQCLFWYNHGKHAVSLLPHFICLRCLHNLTQFQGE